LCRRRKAYPRKLRAKLLEPFKPVLKNSKTGKSLLICRAPAANGILYDLVMIDFRVKHRFLLGIAAQSSML
jgi:hypothetical protein